MTLLIEDQTLIFAPITTSLHFCNDEATITEHLLSMILRKTTTICVVKWRKKDKKTCYEQRNRSKHPGTEKETLKQNLERKHRHDFRSQNHKDIEVRGEEEYTKKHSNRNNKRDINVSVTFYPVNALDRMTRVWTVDLQRLTRESSDIRHGSNEWRT